MAYRMADIFGFQVDHTADGGEAGGERVLSSVANQVEHLSALLANRMDAAEGKDFISLLHNAIAALHHKVLANYQHWVQRVGLLPLRDAPPYAVTIDGDSYLPLGAYNVTLRDFASLEEVQELPGTVHPCPWPICPLNIISDHARTPADQR